MAIDDLNNYLNRSSETTTTIGVALLMVIILAILFVSVRYKLRFNIRKYKQLTGDKRDAFEKPTYFDYESIPKLDLRQIKRNDYSPLNTESISFEDENLLQIEYDKPNHENDFADPLGLAETGKAGNLTSFLLEDYYKQSDEADNLLIPDLDSITYQEENHSRNYYQSCLNNEDPKLFVCPIKESRIDALLNKDNGTKAASFQTKKNHQIDLLETDDPEKHANVIDFYSNEILVGSNKKSEGDMSPGSSTFTAACGNASVEISLLYDAPMRKMTVHVLQAKGITSKHPGQQTHTQIRLLMLPVKKQKHKTKIRSGENPQFMESFLLHRVNPEEVNSMGLRIRVYGCERMRKERLIGEAMLSFATIDLELETNIWLPLESRRGSLTKNSTSLLSLARSDSTESTVSVHHGGVSRLLLGLSYNGTTGRLLVEIAKGSQLRNLTLHKAPDTYVKLCLVNSIGQEMARAKTSTRRGQPNPLFKESFAFQVALFQLNDVTLMVSIYEKRNMKRNEMVGWFSLGLNSSGPEEMAHWIEMREHPKGELLSKWHTLINS